MQSIDFILGKIHKGRGTIEELRIICDEVSFPRWCTVPNIFDILNWSNDEEDESPVFKIPIIFFSLISEFSSSNFHPRKEQTLLGSD